LEIILGGVPIAEDAWLELIEEVDVDKNGQVRRKFKELTDFLKIYFSRSKILDFKQGVY
jgi:hypothetical protein